MHQATQMEPKLWASSMVGFGERHYKYASGHEGDTFLIGFAPRKQNLALYGLLDFEQKEPLLEQLGKHKTGKGCLYINHLDDIHLPVLHELILQSFRHKEQNIP